MGGEVRLWLFFLTTVFDPKKVLELFPHQFGTFLNPWKNCPSYRSIHFRKKRKKNFFSLKVNMFWSPYTEMMNLRANLLEDSKVRYCFWRQLIVTIWMIWKESCGLFPSLKHLGSIVGWIKIICIESKNHPLGTINVEENHSIKY